MSTTTDTTTTTGTGDDRGDAEGIVNVGVVRVVADVNMVSNNTETKEEKPNIREIGETPKPPVRLSQKRREAEQLQSQVVTMLNQDDDEIDLVFQAVSKRIK